ncbi:carbonic anhydrase [Clonorchis sinensis]|uniref:carbonic anhydrase n=1 Tax=Clonorchis sinensis TaxID=79923 RepID=G7YBG3_CLOSI|nr:carbonic anhydrase [Clonorchis sinensis]
MELKMLSAHLFSWILTGLLFVVHTKAAEWSYVDPSSWYKEYPFCSGYYQSPIDINYKDSVYAPKLGQITITNLSKVEQTNYTVINNGHTVEVRFNDKQWEISVGSDGDPYYPTQMHFHWGGPNRGGSEHLLGGLRYAMETHIVSYNGRLFKSKEEAVSGPNGLAVFGILHKLEEFAQTDQTQFGKMGTFEGALASITAAKQSKSIPAFDLAALLGQVETTQYYRYQGSLTTPPCTQNVMWTVFTKSVPVKPAQLELLRSLRTSKSSPLQDNYRPVQPLNDPHSPLPRTVYRTMSAAAGFTHSWWSFVLLSFLARCSHDILWG